MSRRSSKTAKQSAAPDVYVGLLFVAVAALVTGCIFLVMELDRYDWKRPSDQASTIAHPTMIVHHS